jgi:Xaa-Pro aminopeptidase
MRYLDFPVEEMHQKIANAKALIAQEEMSGIVVTGAANHFYFTGFRKLANWATFTRTVFVFIPRDKDPVLYVQEFAGPEAKSRSAVQDVRTFKEIMSAPVNGVVEIMKELGMDSGKVGWELGYEQRMDLSFNDYQAIKEKLPNAQFVDASDLIWKLRMIKLPFEIECMRTANKIAGRSFDRCFKEIHEGMTEKEIARKLVAIMAEEGAELPGFIIVISGVGNYDRISARPTDRVIRKGDLVWIDAGVNYNGYWTDYCRAGVVGGATAEQRRLQSIVHEVTMQGCKAIAPGVRVEEIYNTCAKEFIAHGLPWSFECGRAGHGVGLQLTEPPSIAGCDSTILQPGMVITVEPGYVSDLGCFDIEENVLVTEDGFEILSGGERELHHIAVD